MTTFLFVLKRVVAALAIVLSVLVSYAATQATPTGAAERTTTRYHRF